jgi:hypothetical protein
MADGMSLHVVECPSCQTQIPLHRINSHLDECLQEGEDNGKMSRKKRKLVLDHSSSKNSEVDDVFTCMMQRSKQLYKSSFQVLHLNADYSLSWSDGKLAQSDAETIAWSSTVNLRNIDNSQTRLTLSTSIHQLSSPVQLVSRHSRLSIPVLKSILQKSIRRRRPLPSVRVAMELIDRALGPLLRRISIIIFEDSVLHPDFPLLCWMMAAESKGYKVPSELLEKLLLIIYEIASCPWNDPAPSEESIVDSHADTDQSTLLKCISMRISYGGLKCDMEMLRKYRKLWLQRFCKQVIPLDVRERLGGDDIPLNWSEIPDYLHVRARCQGIQHVINLVRGRLDALKIQDICLEGIDYHCSDVLEQLLKDDSFIAQSIRHLESNGQKELITKDNLLTYLKKCMWTFSSGINFRQPIICNSSNDEDPFAKLFWGDLAASRVKTFMLEYVMLRLASTITPK